MDEAVEAVYENIRREGYALVMNAERSPDRTPKIEVCGLYFLPEIE